VLKSDIRNLYRHEVEAAAKAEKIETMSGLLDMLFGEYELDYRTDYVIKTRRKQRSENTIIHRLNRLWFIPLFVICAAFRYVLFGQAQINEDSKLGAVTRFFLGKF
jgi:hypothetical protein